MLKEQALYAQLIAEKNTLIKSSSQLDAERHKLWWPVYAGTPDYDLATGIITHHDYRPYCS